MTAQERKATAKDVAELAGVRQPTVSAVLNGAKSGTRISEATRKRILEAAAKLEYRPNSSARAMKSGRFGSVAILTSVNPARGFVHTPTINGIHDELAAHGQHLMLVKAADESLTSETVMPRLLREWTVDGLLVGLNQEIGEEEAAPPKMVEIIERHRIPSIWINVARERDCVHPDDERGGYDACRYLLDLGHRRIAYVGLPPSAHYSRAYRQRGYERAMRDAGLPTQVIAADPSAPRPRQMEQAHAWLSGPNRPTAMLFYVDRSASMTLQAAHLRGIRVPEDLSLLAIGDVPVEHPLAVFDTFVIPFTEMGRVAVKQLLHKIEHPDERLSPCKLPLALERGETCARAPF